MYATLSAVMEPLYKNSIDLCTLPLNSELRQLSLRNCYNALAHLYIMLLSPNH